MNLSSYSYDLPKDLIAINPPKIRGDAKLLILNKSNGQIRDGKYSDLVDMVSAGDVIVLNNTKVIPARIKTFKKSTQAVRYLVLIEKHGKKDNWYKHQVIYKGRLKALDVLIAPDKTEIIVDEILGNGLAKVSCKKNLLVIAESYGETPLPPYLKRKSSNLDKARYQTVWAKFKGSVAAPTASLNMTEKTLKKLAAKNVIIKYATLHVGLGTFMPIRDDDLAKHTMHKEYFEIPKDTIAAIRKAKQNGHKVIAIGTTIVRSLEYASINILNGTPQDISGEADIFIYPGYEFKVVDVLLTNFHAPKTTVLMLASAFAGWDNLLKAYEHAKINHYHFLSYGDSMLIY